MNRSATKTTLLRWLLTTINVHLLGAICVGYSSMGPVHGLGASLLFSLFGIPYLIIEAPAIILTQLLIDRIRGTSLLIATSFALIGIGSLLGYQLCFTEGGNKPFEYARGYAVAGGMAATLTIISALLIPARTPAPAP